MDKETSTSFEEIPSNKQENFGKGTKTAYTTIRKIMSMLKEDRVLSEDIEKIKQIVKNRVILEEVEKN